MVKTVNLNHKINTFKNILAVLKTWHNEEAVSDIEQDALMFGNDFEADGAIDTITSIVSHLDAKDKSDFLDLAIRDYHRDCDPMHHLRNSDVITKMASPLSNTKGEWDLIPDIGNFVLNNPGASLRTAIANHVTPDYSITIGSDSDYAELLGNQLLKNGLIQKVNTSTPKELEALNSDINYQPISDDHGLGWLVFTRKE